MEFQAGDILVRRNDKNKKIKITGYSFADYSYIYLSGYNSRNNSESSFSAKYIEECFKLTTIDNIKEKNNPFVKIFI